MPWDAFLQVQARCLRSPQRAPRLGAGTETTAAKLQKNPETPKHFGTFLHYNSVSAKEKPPKKIWKNC